MSNISIAKSVDFFHSWHSIVDNRNCKEQAIPYLFNEYTSELSILVIFTKMKN